MGVSDMDIRYEQLKEKIEAKLELMNSYTGTSMYLAKWDDVVSDIKSLKVYDEPASRNYENILMGLSNIDEEKRKSKNSRSVNMIRDYMVVKEKLIFLKELAGSNYTYRDIVVSCNETYSYAKEVFSYMQTVLPLLKAKETYETMCRKGFSNRVAQDIAEEELRTGALLNAVKKIELPSWLVKFRSEIGAPLDLLPEGGEDLSITPDLIKTELLRKAELLTADKRFLRLSESSKIRAKSLKEHADSYCDSLNSVISKMDYSAILDCMEDFVLTMPTIPSQEEREFIRETNPEEPYLDMLVNCPAYLNEYRKVMELEDYTRLIEIACSFLELVKKVRRFNPIFVRREGVSY